MHRRLVCIGPDLTYVVHRLARRPLYAASVIGVLAVAMGGSLTVFGWVDALLLRPLAVAQPHELVTFERAFLVRGVPQRRVSMTWGEVVRVRSAPGLADAAVSTTSDDRLSSYVVVARPGWEHDNVAARFVTSNYLRTVGVVPIVGRDLRGDDDRFEAAPVAILTQWYWLKRFGGSTDAIGSVVRVNGVPTTVVGVVAFDGTGRMTGRPALFLPLATAPAMGRESPVARTPTLFSRADDDVGSLPFRPAATFQIIARVEGAHASLQAEAITRLRSDEWSVVPLGETMLPFESRADLHSFLGILMAAVALALVIGAINVGMLLYGEAQDRKREFMIRTVLGAPASLVIRLLALEYGLLALASGIGAGGVAALLQHAFSTLALPGGVVVGTLESEPLRVAVLAVGLTLGVAAVIVVFPMMWVGRRTLTTVERAMTGAGSQRVFRLLTVVQAAGCVVIAVAGVFFARTVSESLSADLGFEPTLLAQVTLRIPAQAQGLNALTVAEALVADISAVDGVTAAAIGPAPIVAGSDYTTRYLRVDGAPVVLSEPIDMVYGSREYFTALQPSWLRGRDFGTQDVSNGGNNLVAIVNEAAARLLWPGVDPVGRRLTLDEFVFSAAPATGAEETCTHLAAQPTPVCTYPVRVAETTIIGLVPDMVLSRIGETTRPVVYLPLSQWRRRAGTLGWTGVIPLLVRTERLTEATRLVAQGASNWRIPVDSAVNLSDALDTMIGPQRLARGLLLFLAGTLLLVTLAGIYASAHMAVVRNQRTHAVRLALGSTASRVVAAGLWRLGSTLAAGSAVGALVLWLVHPLIQSFGLGLSLDYVSTGAVVLAVIVVGVFAAYIPSRRIYQVDPARLLRE